MGKAHIGGGNMKKSIALILSLIILLISVPGCEKKAMPSPENPVTLTMWHVYGSQTKSPLNVIIDEFNNTIGKENGITINVVSVTSSSAIDKALAASANGEPGSESMPDLFVAYPRVAEIVGKDRLLAWNSYFTEKELSAFRLDFLSEGFFDDKLLVLPIAKSTEAFYINKTLFDRFIADSNVTYDDMRTFDGIFEAARKYYDHSSGMSFFQINDYYNYAYTGMKAYGSELVRNGRLRLDDEAFEKVWEPLARTAIYGGLCLDDGYAAARWKTAEIIANTGSTADVLYQPTEVIYPDNSTEPIEAIALPYPTFTADASGVVFRGGGMLAVKNEDERKNQAAYIFAKWLTDKENNINFVTQTGYLPVKTDSFELLFSDLSLVENESYRSTYRAVETMSAEYSFYALPLYENASDIQLNFEKNVKAILKAAHSQYLKRVSDGENPEAVLNELIGSTLTELKRLSER